jgi:CHAT domain-containing protein
LLPIHAAGRHAQPGTATVLDRVVSSYAPTVRALRHARRRPHDAHDVGLTVGLRQADGHAPLPRAGAEADLAARFLGGIALRDEGATREAILAALPSATRAHFACHAVTADDPADSHLAVADGAIGIRDLANLYSDSADLAYLSACTTGVGGSHLMDESIHIAAAFQMSGFRHVIATIWPTADRVALEYARRIYERLADSVDVAYSVHQAVREMRQRHARRPFAWASHIHFGP